MARAVFVVIPLVMICVVVGAHWYLWRRLVRDVSAPGGVWRRTGTVLAFAMPLLVVATFTAGRGGAPFAVERVLAWPGYLWLALLIYLLLSLLVGEAVRPLLRRFLERRDAARGAGTGTGAGAGAGRVGVGEGADAGAAAPAPREAGLAVGAAMGAPATVGGSGAGSGSGSGSATEADGQAGALAVRDEEDDREPVASTATVLDEARETGDGADGSASGGIGIGTGSTRAPSAGAGGTGGQDKGAGGGSADTGTDAGADTAGAGPSRRLFVARTVAVGAALVGGATVAGGAYGVLNGPTLKRVTVPLAKLPRQAHGYRIAVVSDIHLGPILGRSHTQRIVETINSAQPDLVAIVGDMVDGSVADLGPAAEPLRNLRSRHGSFFVTGNHEYFGDAAEWVDHVRELGIEPLENARKELPGFDLAGVNDVAGEDTGEGPDFARALGDRDTSRASVLLAHQPVQIHEAVDHGVDLQLSGHTHGGQMWPGEYLAGLANPTVAGLERYGDTQLYVTRGAGAWGPPVRVGAESDVTIVRLAAKRA
ncbi:metallophosphoesterase [Streptomyces sp. NPDC054796]